MPESRGFGSLIFTFLGTSLVVQWLRLPRQGSILGQGTQSHMPQLRVCIPPIKPLCATIKIQCSQINKHFSFSFSILFLSSPSIWHNADSNKYSLIAKGVNLCYLRFQSLVFPRADVDYWAVELPEVPKYPGAKLQGHNPLSQES